MAEEAFTIDELAHAAGLPSRTVRHYQSEKILPRPQRRGRGAVYRDEHLQRLRLIADLQARGLSLRAIRDALAEVERGEVSLEDWLGVSEALRRPWAAEGPTSVSLAELDTRLAGHPDLEVDTLVEVGLVHAPEGHPPMCHVPSPALLDMALALDAAGVDVHTSAGAAALLQRNLARAADDLVDYFIDHAGEGFARSVRPQELTRAIDALRPLSSDAVRLLFAREVERALQQRGGAR